MSCDWTRPFEPDEHTVALYHFDEGAGDEAHDACGDPELTLRSGGRGLWGNRPGFGSTARFERSDANLRIGPANNDKLKLRTCTEAWTVEAWVRYNRPRRQGQGPYVRVHLRYGRGRVQPSPRDARRMELHPPQRNHPGHPRRRTHSGSAIHGLGGQRSEPRHQQ